MDLMMRKRDDRTNCAREPGFAPKRNSQYRKDRAIRRLDLTCNNTLPQYKCVLPNWSKSEQDKRQIVD
jgi:hypothetical protein